MTGTTNVNGRPPRKSLASQLDRLDTILDALSEGLNEAVATAVGEAVGPAVRQAVEAALKEVLASPALLEKLRPATRDGHGAGEVPLRENLSRGWAGLAGVLMAAWAGAAAFLRWLWAQTAQVLSHCRAKARQVTARARRRAATTQRAFWMRTLVAAYLVRQFRRPLLVALGVGAVVGLACYLAGPVVSSAVSGLAGFAGSLAASALAALRRVMPPAEPDRGW